MAVPILKMATIGLLPSPLKVLYYKLTGAKIGKGVKIGMLSVITSRSIEIGDGTKIGPLTFINVRKLKLGKRVRINMMVAVDTGEMEVDNDSTIMEQVVIGGMLTSRSRIFIGKRVKVFPYSFLNPTEPIIIEDDAGIGGANYIFTHGSWQNILDGFPVGFGPVTIKKGVWFPWRVFVMPGVTVGEYSTIGAGSIITKSIPERSLAAGSPAKVLKTGEEYIKNHSFEDKMRIMGEIFSEMADFFTYKFETPYSFVKNSEAVQLYEVRSAHSGVVFFKTAGEPVQGKVNVFFENVGDELKNKLNSSGILWFDISGKKSFYREDKLWHDVKDFFSRYGIRFEIES